jgi:NADP-dependent 3-hydroxy acid dehydrogenase YdfG
MAGTVSAKRVVSTGASTGFGNATLQRLGAAGHDAPVNVSE